MNAHKAISLKTKFRIVLSLAAVIVLTGLCMGVDGTTTSEDHSATSEDYAAPSDPSATTSYTYDSLNRLTRATYPDGSVIRYTYDAAGNRLIQSTTGTQSPTPTATPHTPTPTATATPVNNTYTLSITTAGSGTGTVTASPPGPTYPAGTVVTLTATPDSCSSFFGWSGDVSGTDTTVTVTMNGNKSVTATFAAASVTRFDGSYTGSYSGTYSGALAFTVANGIINVTQPGSCSGTVDHCGGGAVGGCNVSGASISFQGAFSIRPDRSAYASGTWQAFCPSSCGSGTWNASRPMATPTATPHTPTPTATPHTPTPTPTPHTPTPTATPTPTPTPACLWMTKSPVLYNARGIFAVSNGTYVYCGGGYDGSTTHADLLRFNPGTNSWMSLASSPDQHYLSQAVYYNGKIYNMGGFNGSFVPTNITRIYDISANTWTTGAPMPVALSDMATTLWNGTIYVAGGYNGTGAVSTLYAYNIATNTWSTLAPLPQPLYLPGFGAINGRLYIAAGSNGSELNTLYIYNIATNTWITGASVPTAVTGPGSTVYCGKLYLYGGGYPTARNITQIYDPVTNSWSTGPNLNVARLWFYGSAVDSTSIVAPGGNTTSPVNANEQLAGCTCP